jgi:uncharacterized RDD family membrane protein YckC
MESDRPCGLGERQGKKSLASISAGIYNLFKSSRRESRMKCKRCRATVPDDADRCPSCGQDLSSLRQLLSDFYSDEPLRPGERDLPPREPEVFAEEEEPPPSVSAEEPRDEIRIATGPYPDYNEKISLQNALAGEEPDRETEGASAWDQALRGGFWLRYTAMAVDALILLLLLAIFVVLGFLTLTLGASEGGEIPLLRQIRIILPVIIPLGLALMLAYFAFFHAIWGQTIGKMIFGLRVVRTDGQPLSFLRALARALGYILSAIPFFLGFLWVAFSPRKRSWHDALTDTMVTREQ